MCTVLLPLGGYQVAVKKIYHNISYHIISIVHFLLLNHLSANSWMSSRHEGGLSAAFAPISREGLHFSFYGLLYLNDGLSLPRSVV